MADDEPLADGESKPDDEPKPDNEPKPDDEPKSDSTSTPMDYEYEQEHGKTLKMTTSAHRNQMVKHSRMKHIKTRRGYGRKSRNRERKNNRKIKFSLLGSNSNGIINKLDSLKYTIGVFKPSIVTLQETKVRKLGSLKLKGYQIFENIRTGVGGGGLLTAVDQNLNPVLIVMMRILRY